MTKTELREQIRARIRQMGMDERNAESIAICRRIMDSTEWKNAENVWLYAALPDEVDLSLLIHDAEQSGKRIFLPVVDGDDLLLRFYDPKNMESKGKFNISEPTEDCPALSDIDEIDLAIIPGRAFTREGLRMGRGKGYYDRSLKSLRCRKWGAAFSCQIVEELPTDPWDVRLDRIIEQ